MQRVRNSQPSRVEIDERPDCFGTTLNELERVRDRQAWVATIDRHDRQAFIVDPAIILQAPKCFQVFYQEEAITGDLHRSLWVENHVTAKRRHQRLPVQRAFADELDRQRFGVRGLAEVLF